MITRPITRPVTSPIARAVTAAYGAWNPRALFAAGEQGVIYDPSDLSTLWQDSAGTTPVTAAGQPVGLMLDKRLGLVRGANTMAGSDFTNTSAWISPGGLASRDSAAQFTTSSAGGLRSASAFTAGRWYSISLSYSVSAGTLSLYNASTQANPISAATNLIGSGAVQLYYYAVDQNLYFRASGAAVVSVPNISVRELPGNHAFQATAASRPILRQNATTGAYYLETDGSDDWMQTNAIDFTGTDKISLFVGVRKLSDTAAGMVAELSAGVNAIAGSFALFCAGAGGSEEYTFGSRGTTTQYAPTSSAAFNAPHSAVLSGVGNIGADSVTLRVNGSQVASASGDQGSGPYGNHALYLFRRAGASLPLNGHFYGLIIVGRLCTDAETRNVERLYANKTGVVLA